MRWVDHAVSGGVGAGVMAVLLLVTGATAPATRQAVIDAERINIREPDGTLRMVLSGTAREPGIVIRGRERPHPNRRSAGILFYNDEGSENGGLIFDGRRVAGQAQSSGSLTFDRYEQDQAVQLTANQGKTERNAGLVVNDQPDAPIDYDAIDRARVLPPEQRLAAFRAAGSATTRRLFAGRTDAGASEVQLRDAHGAARLILKVDARGAASIVFLNADGGVRRIITPGSEAKTSASAPTHR